MAHIDAARQGGLDEATNGIKVIIGHPLKKRNEAFMKERLLVHDFKDLLEAAIQVIGSLPEDKPGQSLIPEGNPDPPAHSRHVGETGGDSIRERISQ